MNIKTEKKLGEGLMGTVYLSKVDDKFAITKIEKYDGDLTTKSSYIRQLKFNEIAILYPNVFMTLVFSGIKNMCDHKQPIPDWIDGKWRKKLVEKNNLTQCFVLSYSPVLDGTYASIENSLSSIQWHSALYQLINACNILKKHKYYHRDIHPKNIMYKKVGRKYQWYVIDYGMIYNKSFINNADDLTAKGNNPLDIVYVLWSLCDNKLWKYMETNKIKPPPYKQFLKYIKDSDVYSNIKQYLPNTKNKNILDDCIALVTLILHYKVYMSALGMSYDKYPEQYTIQRHANILLYIIKRCTELMYDKILLNIKKLMR